MGRDRHERRHRRTAGNANCVNAMAGANFDAVPSLSEAMGLGGPAVTHTHVGYRRRDVHANVYGTRPCHSHALALSHEPADRAAYQTLCGELIHFTRRNEWGDLLPNVRAVSDPGARRVTCKRCLRLVGAGRKTEKS